MVKSAVSAAVAGLLAVSAAHAANTTVYVSGASAQRSFWQSDLGAICTGNFGTTGVTIVSVSSPDIQSAQCTVTTTGRGPVALPAGISNNDVLTMQYAAEFGSVWGIAPAVAGNAQATGRRFIDLAVGTISDYDANTDTAGSGMIGPFVPDLLVTDIEPSKWASPDNWPYIAGEAGPDFHSLWILGIGGATPAHNALTSAARQPTLDELKALISSTGFQRVNGQIFSIIVNNSGPAATLGSLSSQSVRGILTGQYTTWGQVPEVGGSNTTPISVVRRDHGSGTEVATSLYFTGQEIGIPGAPLVGLTNGPVAENDGNLNSPPIEKNSTNALQAAVALDAGAIGFRGLGTSSAVTTLNLDGVQANAHNAAMGLYGYAYDTWSKNNTTASGASAEAKVLITALLADAANPATLPTEATGSFTGGQWVVTGTNPRRVSYAGQYSGTSPVLSACKSTTTAAPKACFKQSGTFQNAESSRQSSNKQ